MRLSSMFGSKGIMNAKSSSSIFLVRIAAGYVYTSHHVPVNNARDIVPMMKVSEDRHSRPHCQCENQSALFLPLLCEMNILTAPGQT